MKIAFQDFGQVIVQKRLNLAFEKFERQKIQKKWIM